MDRRTVLLSTIAAFGLPGTGLPAAENSDRRKALFQHALPDIKLEDWKVTAVELVMSPGVTAAKHQHPGFVIGYVLEGEYKFQVAGEPEKIFKAGEMFYEAPGAVHILSESASKTQTAKVLALVFGPKDKPIATPDP
jgi:quercetin dioxygenase-like cupin family protein